MQEHGSKPRMLAFCSRKPMNCTFDCILLCGIFCGTLCGILCGTYKLREAINLFYAPARLLFFIIMQDAGKTIPPYLSLLTTIRKNTKVNLNCCFKACGREERKRLCRLCTVPHFRNYASPDTFIYLQDWSNNSSAYNCLGKAWPLPCCRPCI